MKVNTLAAALKAEIRRLAAKEVQKGLRSMRALQRRRPRSHHHHHAPSVHERDLLDLCEVGHVLGHVFEHRATGLRVHDLQVLEGSEALLRCEVGNVAGAVQWTKDGFALGFSAVIPGYPRYSVLGDRNQGVYNLKISKKQKN